MTRRVSATREGGRGLDRLRSSAASAAVADAPEATATTDAADHDPTEAVLDGLVGLQGRAAGTPSSFAMPVQAALLAILVRRHFLVSAAIVLVLAVLTLALVLVTPRSYAATTTLWVDPAADGALQQADGLLSRYLVQRATSAPVLSRAAVTVGDERPTTPLADHVSASALRGTNIIAVTAQVPVPEHAAGIADAVAAATIQQNRTDVLARARPLEDILRAEAKRLSVELDEVLAQFASEVAPGAIEARRQEVAGLQGQVAAAERALFDFQVQQERNAGALVVLDRATLPTSPVGLPGAVYLASAILLGIGAAAAVALLRERLDGRVWSTRAFDEATRSELPSVLVSDSQRADGNEAPALSHVYALLHARHPDMRSVVVLPTTGQGADSARVANGLAAAATRASRKVTLLGIEGAAAVATPELKSAVAAARGSDLVVVSLPSPRDHPMAVTTGTAAPVVVLVGAAGRTRTADVVEATRMLGGAGGAPALGVLTVTAWP